MKIKQPIIGNIEKYGNWIIGANGNKILKTEDFEVGIFEIPKGHKGDGHYHQISDEYNFIIRGKCNVVVNGIKHKLKDGDYFMYPTGVESLVEYTEDTILVCVKVPSATVPDKFYLDKDNEEDNG